MKKLFYIDYPQEHIEGQMHRYRCVHCKEETTVINGRLEGHLPSCEYKIMLESAGYESENAAPSNKLILQDADDFD
jgi:DNA-directed RNA polymerase subunit RPC12/RpoP